MANNKAIEEADDWEDLPADDWQELESDDWQEIPDEQTENDQLNQFADFIDAESSARAPGMLETAARSISHGASLGMDDALTGMLAKYMRGKDYGQYRDLSRSKREAAQRENPTTGFIGELAGAGATAPVSMNPLVQGGVGFAGGAARSLAGEDKIDRNAIANALERGSIDAALSATMTKIAPPIMNFLGKPFVAGYDALRGVAGRQAVKAMQPTQKMSKDLARKGILEDVGQYALDNKIVTPLASSKSMYERATNATDKFIDETLPIYEKTGRANISADELKFEVLRRARELAQEPGSAKVARQVAGYGKDIDLAKAHGREAYSPADIRKYRGAIDKSINFNSDALGFLAGKDMRNLLRNKEMGLIESVDPALRQQNEALFRNIRLGKEAESIAERGAARSQVNNIMGLNSNISGTAAAAAAYAMGLGPVGAAATGYTVGGAAELLKRYGNQMSATAINKVAKAIGSPKYGSVLKGAIGKGGSYLPMLHEQLMRDDPEYRELVDGP